MPGPPPVPNEIKRRRGTARADRGGKPLSQVVALPAAQWDTPPQLRTAGAELWQAARSSAPWLAQSDLPCLTLLCETVDRRAAMVSELTEQDFVLAGDRGFAFANPLVKMILNMELVIVKLFSLIGLSPADRTRIGLGEVKAQSKLEDLRARRAQG